MNMPFILVATITSGKRTFARAFGPFPTRAKAIRKGAKLLREGVEQGTWRDMDDARALCQLQVATLWQEPHITIPVDQLPKVVADRDDHVLEFEESTHYLGNTREQVRATAESLREEAYELLAAARYADTYVPGQ